MFQAFNRCTTRGAYISSRCFSLSHRKYGFKNIVVEQKGKVVIIGINRKEVRNCVNTDTARELATAMFQLEDKPDASAGVLYGVGGNFCSGFDLKQVSEAPEDVMKYLPENVGPMGPSHSFLSKPVIAAVSGYAVAGGLELALWADLRVMEESATMGVFCRRFGVPLIDGGTVRLQALVGLSRALDMILLGRPVKAAEAYQWGLANRVVPDGEALNTSVKLAEVIASFPQECLRADRRSTYHAAFGSTDLQEALKFEFNNAFDVIKKESIPGAKKFASGAGRHGEFDKDS